MPAGTGLALKGHPSAAAARALSAAILVLSRLKTSPVSNRPKHLIKEGGKSNKEEGKEGENSTREKERKVQNLEASDQAI